MTDESADVKMAVVDTEEPEPKISAALEKTVKEKENKPKRREQGPPTENTDTKTSTLSESKQEIGKSFFIPIFLVSTVVGVVCMKGRRAL